VSKLLIRLLPLALITIACANEKRALLQPMGRSYSDDGSGLFKVRGQAVGWGANVGTIAFSFDPEFPAELRIGCVNAAATWNDASDRPLITFTAGDWPFAEGSDGHNVISFGKSRRSFPENHAAETVTRITRTVPARIIEADIDFDTSRFTFGLQGQRRAADVESTCLHELGHALGLTHVTERISIMAPRLTLGTPKRDISDADRDRIRYLYPPPVRQGPR
jgi:hypothetical protein